MGHFGSWPMEGQSSTSRSGWGHHRGPVSTGGVFSSGGKLKFLCLFPSKSLSLTGSENTNPNMRKILKSVLDCTGNQNTQNE